MRDHSPEDIISTSFKVIPFMLDRIFEHRYVCVAGSWMAKEVLTYFGLNVKAVPVNVMAFNDKALDLIQKQVPHADWPNDAWAVGAHHGGLDRDDIIKTTPPDGRPGWDGHLILHADVAPVLLGMDLEEDTTGIGLDYTAWQMSRPERDLNVSPCGFPVPLFFWEGELVSFRQYSEATMNYQYAKENRGFRDAPDWKDGHKRYDKYVGQMIRMMRDSLGEDE